jgi:hypothetical protein
MRHFGSVHSQQTPFGVVKRVVVDHASCIDHGLLYAHPFPH